MTDAQIIEGINNKDQAAQGILFEKVYRELVYFAYRMVDNMEEGKDLAIRCFSTLLEYQREFADIEHVKNFLFTTTKNACINHLRKRQRVNSHTTELIQRYSTTENWEILMDRAELLHELYRAVEQLPAQSRTVFKLTQIEGFSYHEVATILGLSPHTVRNHNARAFELLRSALGERKLHIALLLLHLASTGN